MSERIGEYLVAANVPAEGRKTFIADIRSNEGVLLGQVKWYGAWRQYAFYPEPDTIFNAGCLQDLDEFLQRVTIAHREKRRNKGPQ